jgi:Protein of unknown function (DUF1570)
MSVLPEAPADPRSPRQLLGRSTRTSAHLLSVLLLTSVFGCHSLGLFTNDRSPPKKEIEQPAADAVPPAPNKYSMRIPPCFFYSDIELKADAPTFKDLASLPTQVYTELKLTPPATAAVQVYLFEDEAHYKRYMKAKEPGLPDRRAFFIANPRPLGGQDELVVYTFIGPRLQQDLRHELTHALVHSVLKRVPQWLDEGLAEYFELPPGSKGLNSAHLARLQQDLARGMKPDLARLEGLREVNNMDKEDYRESWAWVHLMLHGKPEVRAVLIDYLRLMRDGREPPPLGPRLAAVMKNPEESLTRHVLALETDWNNPPATVQRTGGLLGDKRTGQ